MSVKRYFRPEPSFRDPLEMPTNSELTYLLVLRTEDKDRQCIEVQPRTPSKIQAVVTWSSRLGLEDKRYFYDNFQGQTIAL